MNREHASLLAMLATGILLLTTANILWLIALLATSTYYGWNLGKRLLPAEEYGA